MSTIKNTLRRTGTVKVGSTYKVTDDQGRNYWVKRVSANAKMPWAAAQRTDTGFHVMFIATTLTNLVEGLAGDHATHRNGHPVFKYVGDQS